MNDTQQIVAEAREKIARDFKLILTPRGETDMDAHILTAIEKAMKHQGDDYATMDALKVILAAIEKATWLKSANPVSNRR